ncbi:recombinase family protein [Flavisolibacter ginsenosidimutans]
MPQKTTKSKQQAFVSLGKFAKGANLKVVSDENCVIYTRVSTKEQAEGNLSLDTQKKACELHALKNGYNILSHFGGTYESAASDERIEFKKLIEYCKKQKLSSLKIIVYSLDRFSRTGDNAIWLSRQLRDLGIQIVSVTQPIDTNNPAGVLQQNILFLFSQYDNDLRRQKTIAGMKEKLLQGVWPCGAPMGYDNITINSEKSIVINEKGRLIRKAFIWKANEGITMVEIIKRLAAQGLKVSISRMSEILQNPFYCGILSHSLLEGEMIEGKHEKLISKELFLRANEQKAKIPHGYKANLLNENLPLKLFVKCDSCKENLRGYIVKAKNLYYYKCDNGSQCSCNVSAKKLHGLFETILDEVTLYEDYIDLYQLQLRKIYNTLNTEREELLQQYKLKSKELEEKIERLEERFINEEIKADLYEKFSRKFKGERKEMEAYVGMTTFSASNLEKFVKRSTEYLMELPSVWTSSDYKGKQTLQFSIFPEGIHYSKKIDQPRTVKMNSIFTLTARQKGLVEERGTGTSELIFRNSGLVASTGIEPVSGASETLILSIVLRGQGGYPVISLIGLSDTYFISPCALNAKIFTAMASNITPKNFRTAINPAGPKALSIRPIDFNTIKIKTRLARMPNKITGES